ncbi:MAG: transcription-repair coupling factor [Trueperaceae bacterium]|nr:transcription-repair coupling factor [Trueperaceae bacterium]
MTETAPPTTEPIALQSNGVDTPSRVRLLGLPGVARLARFARHDGPAVLVTTAERLPRLEATGVFGVRRSVDPTLEDWHERAEKVVLSVQHALTPFPSDPSRYALELAVGGTYARDDLLERLVRYGYTRDEAPGFRVRGDTIEILASDDATLPPLRLEFFGNELESMTRSGVGVPSTVIGPRDLAALHEAEEADADAPAPWTSSVLASLPGTVYLDAPELMEGELGDAGPLWHALRERDVVSFGRDPLDLSVRAPTEVSLPHYRAKLRDAAADLETWLRDGYAVHLLLGFERTGRYLRERVIDHLPVAWHRDVAQREGEVAMILAPRLEGGYRDPERREVVVTEELLYGYQGGRSLKRLPGRGVHDPTSLSVGDFLIHPDHGVGRFLGLEPRQVVGVTRDYLLLQYAGEGKLYLPVEHLPMLRRHSGTTDDPPRLSTLGTNEWSRSRERARASAEKLAAELIKSYAARQVASGVSFGPLPEWDPEIESGVDFDLTPDQVTAVAQTFADMAKPVPMDRLISGDVGFGKTEVAIRAAHRVVGHGYQAAMLVPTTVLASQHFETFKERFAGLPVRVEMLSRFSSDKEADVAMRGLADGTVDVVIGTHRLLSEGLRFARLGLLIVDEEHRFGVQQKERLKALKSDLDVISLSATPIPRTLYMSLVGLRDVSQIMTPPVGRKPIQTVLQPYDPITVRDAILFEIERGGRVYYIHDRIGSMSLRGRTLAQLVPEARIGVAHGQMASDELEDVMLGFHEGAFDVLLATTIVESGLDVAGANTLVIERADRLGLAQLYQLRGRVGRRQTEAWAYLLYPGKLTEQAQRRLYAIAELDDLGSGHRLAEKDMEIRGVGNLLGPEQHGQIAAVSLEVYTEMLAEEIAKLKGERAADGVPRVAIDLAVDARLSPGYVADDAARVGYYGRLAEAATLADLSNVTRELRERYGPFPSEVRAFIDLAKLRLLAAGRGVASITEHMTDVQISFHDAVVDYDPRRIKELRFTVAATRYPPGFSIKKRGIGEGAQLLGAITDVLFACA